MALHNFLVPGMQRPLRLADVVFQITTIKAGADDRPRPAGHAGLVAKAKADHVLGGEVVVYHMTASRVEKDRWADGLSATPPITDSRVDVAGTKEVVEDSTRFSIIDEAFALFQRTPSLLDDPDAGGCYWLGDASATRHPNYPGATDGYAFSCTSFVHHCYQSQGTTLVVIADVPLLRPQERALFERWGYRTSIQPDPVHRVSCGHLICAFEASPERFPFRPADGDWEACGDRPTFRRLLEARDAAVALEFTTTATRWLEENKGAYDLATAISHPDYRRIVEMGWKAVPLILQRVAGGDRAPWWQALRQITGENPVRPEDAGHIEQVAQRWLAWGKGRERTR